MNAQTHRYTSDAMTILFELLRNDAGKTSMSYAFTAIAATVRIEASLAPASAKSAHASELPILS